ncbi:hypothetical protein AX279_08155 [Pseudomonas sp. J237]|nr:MULTISPECIES: hypothetical protein [Pseudomonas]OEO26761.1 hypothetical protein AX279_08155 [Pseudomonas sp. J237]
MTKTHQHKTIDNSNFDQRLMMSAQHLGFWRCHANTCTLLENAEHWHLPRSATPAMRRVWLNGGV